MPSEHRFDNTPLIVAEFMLHDSRLRFWSVNHIRDDDIKSGRGLPKLPAKRTSGGQGRINAIDPNQTYMREGTRDGGAL